MNSPAADAVLDAVRRQLRLVALADAARFAAWTTVAVALVAVLLHLFVRPVSFAPVALTVTACWAVALIQAAATRVTGAECAAWADRNLGGRSAFATYVEIPRIPERQDSPAQRRLVEWLEQTAPRSLGELASMQHDAGLLKPVAVALVAGMLALVLLQVPAHRSVLLSSASRAETSGRPAAAMQPGTVDGGANVQASGGRGRLGSQPDRTAGADGGKPTAPTSARQRASAEHVEAAGEAQRAMGATEAASGGRDAGESPDTVPDPGLSDAWQGAMAASLRPLSQPPREQARTDATLSADFAAGALAQATARDSSITPAAAAPPETRQAARLGPAEQAYVRAYFAGPGAEP